MPWFIQLIMAIFMIILYIAIFMGMYTSSSYSDKRILYSFGIGTYSTLLLLFWILQYSIHEGYHSYLTEEMAKGRMYSAEIGIFEIPVGATVYINYAYREVVSTDIKYLGLLEK